MKLEKCICFKTFLMFWLSVNNFAFWLLFLVVSWIVGIPREWSWNQNNLLLYVYMTCDLTLHLFAYFWSSPKKLHKGVVDYSTDRPLTHLRLNQARWLLADFPATVTPSKLCADFKFNVNNLFIIFFILLVIYSVWQNNKIKKSI